MGICREKIIENVKKKKKSQTFYFYLNIYFMWIYLSSMHCYFIIIKSSFHLSIWMSNSPALSWAPVWVSVCLWAKLKDPSDNGQPERSTRRSSSPSRTSAKTWNQRQRDNEIKSKWRIDTRLDQRRVSCSLQCLCVLRGDNRLFLLLNLNRKQ